MYTSWKIFWGGLLGGVVGIGVWAGWVLSIRPILDQPGYNGRFDSWFPAVLLFGPIHGLLCAAIIGLLRLKIFKGGLAGFLSFLSLVLVGAMLKAILSDYSNAPAETDIGIFQVFIIILFYWTLMYFLLFVPAVITGSLIGALREIPEKIYSSRGPKKVAYAQRHK